MTQTKITAEKELDNLYGRIHKYLDRGHILMNLYVPKKVRGVVKTNKRTASAAIRFIEPALKLHPELRKSFKYGRKTFKKAVAIYEKVLSAPPKDITKEQLMLYKVIWESIHTSHLLDEITHQANYKAVLEQALVATCTAYECLVRDSFQWALNNVSGYAKKYISTQGMPIKELAKYDYKPLENAGTIFSDKEGTKFMIFENGKKVYSDILQFKIFRNKKIENKLWRIFQTRHCIIHNGGKPDAIWKRNTRNSKFKTDITTLKRYIEILHNEFHIFFIRLYQYNFKKKPDMRIKR